MSRHYHLFLVLMGTAVLVSATASAQEKSVPTNKRLGSAAEVPAEAKANVSKLAGMLIPGQVVRERLALSDPQLDDESHYDRYEFTGSRGDRVIITMVSEQFDPYLMLIDADTLDQVSADDDSGGGLDARIEVELPDSGRYLVVVNSVHADGLGSYELHFDTESAGEDVGAATAVPERLAVGEALVRRLTGSEPRLGDGSPYDLFVVPVQRGQIVVIDMTSEDFDAYLSVGVITGGSLAPMAQDDDSGGGTNARVQFEVPRDMELGVLATTFDPQGRGSYEVAASAAVQADAASSEPPGGWSALYDDSDTDPNDKFALLVGIDDYPGSDNDLGSCVADTRLMRQLLVDRLGFKPQNIITIHDAQATRDHIIAAFRSHLSKAGPDGRALFYFSGHGLQLPENVGITDDEPDRQDEAISVWGHDRNSSIIVDDEISWLVQQLPSRHMTVILDSCHSGTASRGPEWPFRGKTVKWEQVADRVTLPQAYLTQGQPDGAAAAASDGVSKAAFEFQLPLDHILLAAARSDQLAESRASGWPTHGGTASTFTYFLVRELEEGQLQRSWEEVIDSVRQRIREYANGAQGLQEPQAEGQDAGESVAAWLDAPRL